MLKCRNPDHRLHQEDNCKGCNNISNNPDGILGRAIPSFQIFWATRDDEDNKIDYVKLKQSCKAILRKLKSLGRLFTGTFVREISSPKDLKDPSVLEDFKLIDFEFGRKVRTPYRFAMRNDAIQPAQFQLSYMPRKHEHDGSCSKQILRGEF